MDKNNKALAKNLHHLEMDFEKIVMLSETIKNFGAFSDEVSGGTEKIQDLAELLADKCKNYQNLLEDTIPELQAVIDVNPRSRRKTTALD